MIDLCTSVFVFLTRFFVDKDKSITLYHSGDSKVTIRFEDWEDAIKAMRFFEERRSLELEKYRMSLETGHAQAAGFCGGYAVLALGASAGNNVEYAGPYGYPVPARGEAKPAPLMSLSEPMRRPQIGLNTQASSLLDRNRAAPAAQPQTGAVAVSAQGTTSAAERKDKSKASACGELYQHHMSAITMTTRTATSTGTTKPTSKNFTSWSVFTRKTRRGRTVELS